MRKTSVDDGYPHMTNPVNVCDVEKIYRWFSEAEHYVRINFVVTLLENCCGFEYRFIAACLENMCQKAYKSLVDEEKKANCKEEIEKLLDNDTRTRYNLIIFLSLLRKTFCTSRVDIDEKSRSIEEDSEIKCNPLVSATKFKKEIQSFLGAESETRFRSTNEKCAVAIYNKICSSEECRLAGNYDASIEYDSLYNKELGQKLLLYTLGSKHPAFSFHHRRKLCETARNLVRHKEGANKIAVAAAHCTQPAASTYIREQYNQPVTHTHPIRAACAKNAASPAKGAVNPTFTLQVTWSDHHISHAKHTSEDFSYLHEKVMQMVEQNSAAQESLQKLRNNGFATSDTVDNYLKCLFSSSVPQAIHQSETLFKFFKPRVKSRSTIDGETDTTLSTTSTNRERDPFIKSKTVDSSPRNNSGNMRDQNLSKEAPAVIRTSPRRTSANTNQTLAVPGTGDNRVPQMHDTADCVGNNVGPTSQAVRDDGALNTTAAAKVESSAALEISEGQKQMQSRKPTIQFGEHTANIRQFSAVLKQSANHVEKEHSKVEAAPDLQQPTAQLPPEMPANIAFNIQSSGSAAQLDPNAVQRSDSVQIVPRQVLPVQQQQQHQQLAHPSGEEFCRIAAVDTNEISNVPVSTLVVSPNKATSNTGPQQIPLPPLPPGQIQQQQQPSAVNSGQQLVQNGSNTASPANPMLNANPAMRLSIATGEGSNDNIIMLTPHGLAAVQAAGMGNAGVIHVPIHPCFYQAPPPQHLAQNPSNQNAPTMSTQNLNPGQGAVSSSNAPNVNNLSESKANLSNPPNVKVPLASDIVKGVASAPKLSPNNNVPGPSGSAQTNPDQLPNSTGNQFPQREATGSVDGGNAMKHAIPPQPPTAWLLDQHLHDPASRQTALSNLAALNKLAPVEPQTGLGQTLMPFKYGAVAATGAANLNIPDRAFISQHPTAAAAPTINPQVWQLLHHAQGNQLPMPNRQPYNNLAVTSNLVPGQIVMTPTYHKHLLPTNHFITHVPGMAMEAATGQPMEMPGGPGSNLVLSPTAPREVFCSNCGRPGHCFHDCAEPSMNTILNSEGFRIQTEGEDRSGDSNSSPNRPRDPDSTVPAGSNSVNQLSVNSDHSNHLQPQQQNSKEPRSSSSTCSNNEYSGNRSYQSNKNSQHQQQSVSHPHISKQSHNNQQQHSRGSNSSNTPAKQHNQNPHQQENQRQNLIVPKQILQRGSGGPSNNKDISPRKQNYYNSKSNENITSSSSAAPPPHMAMKGQSKQQQQHTQNPNTGAQAASSSGGGANKSGNSKPSSTSSSSVVSTSGQMKGNASVSPAGASAGGTANGVTSSSESR